MYRAGSKNIHAWGVGQYCDLSDASGLPLGLWCLAVRGLLSQMNGEGGPRPCLPPIFFFFLNLPLFNQRGLYNGGL